MHVSLSQNSPFPTTDTEEDLSGAFSKLAVTHCVRGAVLSLAGLMAYLGTVTVEEDTAATLAVFVLPLNAALNPCLYAASRAMAHQRHKAHRRILAALKRRTFPRL
jgi:hypothetical protein